MWVITCCIGDFPAVFRLFSKEQLRLKRQNKSSRSKEVWHVEEEKTENVARGEKDQCSEG
jgi:hypothetical protein